jgi:hypothetical protein
MNRWLCKMALIVVTGGLLWLPDAGQGPRALELYPPFGGSLESMQAEAARLQHSPGNPNSSTYTDPVDQLFPPARAKAAHVEISQGPQLELARDNVAIITWTTNNPGGTDQHFGVVYYGANPGSLNLVAQSPIRLNRGHPETIFRVRLSGLKPYTTYSYTVTSVGSDGASDGVQSAVRQFTTPGAGD